MGIAKRVIAKLADHFEKELIAQCNQVNGDIVTKGLDNPIVEYSRRLANTVFIDSHKNEKFRVNQLYSICRKVGISKGFEIYFRRPLNFLKIGKMLLA